MKAFQMRRSAFAVCALLFLLALTPVSARKFYLDSDSRFASDSYPGTSPDRPWLTLSQTRAVTAPGLLPGDTILLKRGGVWTSNSPENKQNIVIGSSGTADLPIVVMDYGSPTAPLPKIQSGTSYDRILLNGASHIKILNLEISSVTPSSYVTLTVNGINEPVRQAVGSQMGIRLRGSQNVTIEGCVMSGLTRGVLVEATSTLVKIRNCKFLNNNLMDKLTDSGELNCDVPNPDRSCYDDTGAQGITLFGNENEVSYCEFSGQVAYSFDFDYDGSGIEVFGGRRNFIHHNKATNNVAFTELGGDDTEAEDNVYAFNLVVSDLPVSNFLVTRGGGSWGTVHRTKVYNNTVYLTGLHRERNAGWVCSFGCEAESILTFKNNIIIVKNKVAFTDEHDYDYNNIYWNGGGAYPSGWLWSPPNLGPGSFWGDPMLENILDGDFRPKYSSDSPVIGRGTPVSEVRALGVTTDLEGHQLPNSGNIDIGAIMSLYSLPVSLSYFNGRKEGNSAILDWTTTEESNSDRFEIEWSGDGKTWFSKGVVPANYKSFATINYQFKDIMPAAGQNYYRLRMVDVDLSFALSQIVNLFFEQTAKVAYPNPVGDKLTIGGTSASIRSVALIDHSGKTIYGQNPVSSRQIDVRNIAQGEYLLRITYSDGTLSTHKIVVSH